MQLKFKEALDMNRPVLVTPSNICVTRKVHEQIREISMKTGLPIKEVTDMLMRYALENVEWEK